MENLKTIIVESKTEIKIDELPVILADKTQMIQVFQNLLANAVKFQVKDNIPEIRISAERKTDEWLFSVKDNGIGISKEGQTKIFDMFYRVSDETDGTGLGLFLVKETIEKLKTTYVSKRKSYSEELSRVKQSVTERVATQINQYVRDFSEENKYDIVLGANGSANIWYSVEKNDITKELIAYANKKYDNKKN